MVAGIIAANGISVMSLVAAICGSFLSVLPKQPSSKSTPPKTIEPEPTMTKPEAFRLYRKNELNRIVENKAGIPVIVFRLDNFDFADYSRSLFSYLMNVISFTIEVFIRVKYRFICVHLL
ncbi:MAG: hypothetical protein DSM106950_05665 [Stigonema ocellatum SAG 48.90 = DSM 106950]|nr:hypothetical protein [Stigonema ocellatum SAG 48.90 = DSM 106950]